MKLPEALEHVFNSSARIRRGIWSNSTFVSLVEARLVIIGGVVLEGDSDGLPHPWIITESDWFADDWEVVE